MQFVQNFGADYTFWRHILLAQNRTFAKFTEFTCSPLKRQPITELNLIGTGFHPTFSNIKAHVVKPITGKGYDVVPIVAFDMRAGSRSDALSSNPIPNGLAEHPGFDSSLEFDLPLCFVV